MGKPNKWKRRKPISARAHCKMCKPWKINGAPKPEREKFSDYKRRYFAKKEMLRW